MVEMVYDFPSGAFLNLEKSGKVQTPRNPWAVLKSGMASFSPSARLVNYGHLEPGASQVFHLAKNPPSFQISVDRLKIPMKHLVILRGKQKSLIDSHLLSLYYYHYRIASAIIILSSSIVTFYHLTSRVPAQHVVAAKRLGSQDDAEGLLGSQHQLSHVHTIFGLGEGLDPGWMAQGGPWESWKAQKQRTLRRCECLIHTYISIYTYMDR